MKRVDVFSMQIIAKYFLVFSDYFSIIQVCKKYEFLLDRFRINPIRISPESKPLFTHIQTQIVYTPYDIIVPVDRHIFLYFVTYKEYKEKNTQFEVYKNVRFTTEDIEKYGSKIPEEISQLGDYLYFQNMDLKSVQIPSKVTKIGEWTFNECGLTKIEIPSTVKVIQYNSFGSCGALKVVKLPENITVIPKSCFENCTELENINFPESLQFIDDCAFLQAKLVNVVIPNKCEIGYSCFAMNSNLTRIVLNGVSCIPDFLCDSCSSLKRVEVSKKLIEIGEFAFARCESLENFDFNEDLKYIGNFAFKYCKQLKIAHLKKKVCYVGTFAFMGCEKLEEIVIENKNVFVGIGVIEKCDRLTKISIPFDTNKIEFEITENELTILNKLDLKSVTQSVDKMFYSEITVENDNMDFSAISKIGLYENQSITNVDLNTSLEQVGINQIVLNSLTSLFIPSTVALVNDYCIGRCNSLKNFVVPKYATSICKNAVCQDLITRILFPKNTTQFDCKFECWQFTEFEILNGVKEVEENTFCECDNLEKIVIPSTVTKINENFVVKCTKLSEIEILKNDNNSNLLDVEKVILKNQKLPNDLLEIPEYIDTLYACMNFAENVTQINVPSTITKIENSAFSEVNNLCVLTLPDTLKEIGKHIFSHNIKLTKIDIGNNTQNEFDKFVVSYCCHLRLLNYGYHFNNIELIISDVENVGNTFDVTKVRKFATTSVLNTQLFDNVPPLVTEYCDLLLNTKHLIIPSEVTEMIEYSCVNMPIHTVKFLNVPVIAKGAFSQCHYLTQIVFNETLKRIKKYAFESCLSLKDIVLPKSLQNVGSFVFEGCYLLTKVSCENENVIYGTKCLAFCVSLKKVPVITNMGVAMFFECKSLSQISLSENCKEISDFAFFRCLSLTKIDIPKSVTKIGVFSFRKCVALREIEIPKSVEIIEDGAFYDCKNIKKVVIDNSNVMCGVDVFEGCEEITTLQIGNEKEKYQFEVSYSFYLQMKNIHIYCENVVVKRSDVLKYGTAKMINEIQMNKLIHRLDEGCFFMNSELTKIEVLNNVTEIGNFAFYNCLNLKEVILPTTIVGIPHYCFDGCSNLSFIELKGNIEKYGICCLNQCLNLKGKVDIPEEYFESQQDESDEID
ncbi:hypothetical protein EIN_467600 [Entamoeba invadens IP1]|uniref:Leucine rich repeat containing protein BspA family protein n=1 Tax=Entamoeba invadens IP1 TaxID=370355 RepID=A0A0A1TYQ8_ENTIV|nr:hypothetical protein EIN_467600 [Entamoeba invadens IP1]ELP83666.1 hypothetical protein EIN_467600 [Entamoeba invadens IP1]|eukprot:XP_004183012.1 hypothetical protein EIN_467600 [Entamoeba invadens IP1]